jgi:hypothetical protein
MREQGAPNGSDRAARIDAARRSDATLNPANAARGGDC